MSSRLESLPTELLLYVVEHITRPSELRSLCLMSTTLRVPATTVLYKRVVFDKANPQWISLKSGSGMLSKANPGLGQIRQLCFSPQGEKATVVEERAMMTVLRSLPDNTLRAM